MKSQASLPSVLLFALLFLFLPKIASAGSATWNLNPTSGDWNTAVNWTPATVPNGPSDAATFALSNTTEVALSASTTIGGIVFSPGASAFTLSTSFQTLEIEGAGITNNSGLTQTFLVPTDLADGRGLLEFFNTATAGGNTNYIIEGSEAGPDGGRINFWDSSTAGDASFVLEGGGQNAGTTGGLIFFMDTSTAENATFDCQSGGSGNGVLAGVDFVDNSSAGNATLIAEGVNGVGSFNGAVLIRGESTAANATLIANDGKPGGLLYFDESSTGDHATVKVYGNGNMQMPIAGTSLSIGSLEGDGIVLMESKNLSVGRNNTNTIFRGAIEGSGTLTKLGTGVFVLAENGKRSHTGPVIVERGALFTSDSPASATGAGPVQVNHGTFGGKGTVAGDVTIGNGTGPGAFLAPGINGIGVLTIQSSLTFRDSSRYNWNVQATAIKTDETVAQGITIETNVLFQIFARGNVPLPIGTVFTAISNTAATSIAGAFANLPDGGTVTVGSNTFQASYEGGDGNDLTLTVVP
jgi:hypothetical protein